MSMTPERVAEHVAELFDSIRQGGSHSYAQHNAEQTIGYIRQMHEMGIIDVDQFNALVAVVVAAEKEWRSTLEADDSLLYP